MRQGGNQRHSGLLESGEINLPRGREEGKKQLERERENNLSQYRILVNMFVMTSLNLSS